MDDTVLFLCAHNDDQLIGAGGTLAKYSKEGKNIISIIFSFGESSLPHMQEKESRKTRVLESKRAAKILGEDNVFYIGLTEGKFRQEMQQNNVKEKIENMIAKYRPYRIFTHSVDDPHPDHQAVYSFTMDYIEHSNFKGDVFSYNIWNLFFNLRNRHRPKLVVDITDTFKNKIDATAVHKSQSMTWISLKWNIYVQAIINGFNNGCKYAEVFIRIK